MSDILVHFLLNYAEEEYLEIYPEEKKHVHEFTEWLQKRMNGELKQGEKELIPLDYGHKTTKIYQEEVDE